MITNTHTSGPEVDGW